MTIDPLILLGLYALSFIPFVVLGIASNTTRRYAKRLAMADADQSTGSVPFLVRLHGITVRTLRASLISNLGATMIFFGFPLLIIGILWPQDLLETFEAMRFWIILWVFMSLLRVFCTSPDPTGGLGERRPINTDDSPEKSSS